MTRLALSLLALTALTGCMCLPEEGDSMMNTGYFSDCWNEASKGPGNQVMFPKP